MGNTTMTVTVIRIDVAVCAWARLWTILEPLDEFTSAESELAWFRYRNRINCSVYSLLFVINSSVSWKAFHWFTPVNIATVASIGLITGIITLINILSVPAPSISAASYSSLGIDSTNVLHSMIKKGEIILGSM
jgi:hypothetical protein